MRSAVSSFVFVNAGAKQQLQLPLAVSPGRTEQNIAYFFHSFLPMNSLSSGSLPLQSELQNMMRSSAALRDALCAVAALHRHQRAQWTDLGGEDLGGRCGAMQFYVGSVRSVQARITHNKFADDPSTLWTTFLLGLFEVCCTFRPEVTTI
jgi:hypothetical protein